MNWKEYLESKGWTIDKEMDMAVKFSPKGTLLMVKPTENPANYFVYHCFIQKDDQVRKRGLKFPDIEMIDEIIEREIRLELV